MHAVSVILEWLGVLGEGRCAGYAALVELIQGFLACIHGLAISVAARSIRILRHT